MMILNAANATSHSRPATLADQTPREQVDQVLAQTAAGTMPPPPPFLDQTAGKTPAEIKAATVANAKKGAKARATGPKLSADRKTAPMLPKNIEPAGKAMLKDQAKKEAKVKKTKKAARKAAAKPVRKVAAKKAPKPAAKKAAAPKAAGKAVEGLRPGTKLAIVAGLLTRKEGCTGADVLKATAWPSVSMPQQAKAAGLKLRKEKAKGEPTRYFGSAA